MARSKVLVSLPAGEKPIIDVSEHNGRVKYGNAPRWELVAPCVSGAIIRVADGLRYPDLEFDRNYDECVLNNVPVGVYFYFRASARVEEQMRYFVDTVEGHDCGPGLGWWADFETQDGIRGQPLIDRMSAFLEGLRAEVGDNVGIYTGQWWWQAKYLNPYPAWSGIYPLWAAHWTSNPAVKRPLLPLGWTRHSLWQYGKCRMAEIPGIVTEVDLSRRNPVSLPGQLEKVERLWRRAALLGWDLRTPEG